MPGCESLSIRKTLYGGGASKESRVTYGFGIRCIYCAQLILETVPPLPEMHSNPRLPSSWVIKYQRFLTVDTSSLHKLKPRLNQRSTSSSLFDVMSNTTNSTSWNQALWDFFPSYRLNVSDLEDYLTKKFGRYEFYIEVCISYLESLCYPI